MSLSTEIQKMSWKSGAGDNRKVFTDILHIIMQSICTRGKHLIEHNLKIEENKNYRDSLSKVLINIGEDLEKKPFADAFGDCFMELFSNDCKGQFFTPENVSKMMCRMTLDYKAQSEKRETINDPACGSGRTLLSAAELLERNCFLVGQDLDQYCVWMTTCNFILHSIEGDVIHGNTLTNDLYAIYKVRLHPILRLPYLIVEDLRHIKNVIALANEAEKQIAKRKPNRNISRKITEENEQ
jgi:type I restriction-modification system DNA methylase subunit